jgi:glucan phosphoethanolaminetransferase (alkaline phosphatase superfamily)
LILVAPILLVLTLDYHLRGSRFQKFDGGDWQDYFLSIIEGGVLWGVLLLSAARRRGLLSRLSQGLFVLFLTLALGGQAYFFEQYNAYLNTDVSRFATDFSESVLNQLYADAGNYLSFKLPALALALALLFIARHVVRPGRTSSHWAGVLAPVMIVASLFLPVSYKHKQASSPDVLYMHALGGLLQTQLGLTKESNQLRPRARQSRLVPRLTPRPSRERNVVFVITESVRKDATCNRYDPKCRRTAATNALFPDRVPLSQMRALDSSTAISLAVLWAGIGPHESREVMHTWPLVFDYARSAGYTTAFWTSQNIMFGNLRLWLRNLRVDSIFTGTDVEPESDIDLGAHEKLFADRALRELPALKEPFFLTIQLSNGHYPYLVDESGPQPFQPATTSKAPKKNEQFFNYYQNAIHQQDEHLGRVLRAIKESPAGERTVVVYTSDHGEAFREHHQMGHTFSVYDEEVLVPAWIHAPPGSLSEEETEHLAAKKDEYSFHPDLTATVIDLLGVWEDPALAKYRKKILGESLLRPELNTRALPMTNCAAVWSCAFENWGMMRGHMKLEARAWDFSFHCWDLKIDPDETLNLGAAACGDLKDRALATFKRLPGKDKTK